MKCAPDQVGVSAHSFCAITTKIPVYGRVHAPCSDSKYYLLYPRGGHHQSSPCHFVGAPKDNAEYATLTGLTGLETKWACKRRLTRFDSIRLHK